MFGVGGVRANAGPLRVGSSNATHPQSAQMNRIQRSRLLAGAVAAIDELGYERANVRQITARARVSRRTFYEAFANREECFAAVLQDVVDRIQADLDDAALGDLSWRERIRMGTWTILDFCDREPRLARVCVVHALRAGGVVQAYRERVLAQLVAILDEGRSQSATGAAGGSLTAEGLVGATFAIAHARLFDASHPPLTDLFGELLGMIVLPYLGAAAARRERERVAPGQPRMRSLARASSARGGGDPLKEVPMRMTYRTARVLEGVGELAARQGSHPSNRQVAVYAGINDAGQISKLLARLERLGLLAKGAAGHVKGEPNAWALTPTGEAVIQSINLHTANDRQVA
jgi:AcrR family transcriptional regulator